MIIYISLLIITAVIYILCVTITSANGKRDRFFLVVSSIPIILTMGLRDKFVGTDTIQYYSAFNQIIEYYGWLDYKQTRYEFGYYLLNKVVGLFTEDPQVFLFTTSVIIVVGIFIFIYRNSSNIFISVMLFQSLYFYCNSFNLVRQYIAIAIVVNSIFFIREKKYFKTSVIIILASTFHSSALFILPPALLLCKFKVDRSNIGKYLLWIGLLGVCVPYLIQLSITVFPRYEFYLTYSSIYSGGKIMPYLYLLMVIVGLNKVRKMKISDVQAEKYYLLSVYVSITVVLSVISNFYFESASRLIPYFSLYLIIFIPDFIDLFKHKLERFLILYAALIFTLVYYLVLLNNGVAGVSPYSSFRS